MACELDGDVVATARFRQHAAANGHSAWIVSTCPGRLFSYAQSLRAQWLAGCLAVGYDLRMPETLLLSLTWRFLTARAE